MKTNNPFEFIFEKFTPNEFCNIFAAEEHQTRAFLLSFAPNKSNQREVTNIYDDNEFTDIVTEYLKNGECENINLDFAGEIAVYLEGVLEKESAPPHLKYTGKIVNGLRHGNGKAEWANGNTYEGDFVGGKRTGKGKLTLP